LQLGPGDNEAKACLDEVALALQRQSDAKAVVVGESTAAEKTPPKRGRSHAKVEDVAAQRAVNTKEYLVTEKGIDASRISVNTGTVDAQMGADYLIPSGATFSADVTGTTPVDEMVVKPEARRPLAKKHPHQNHRTNLESLPAAKKPQ
jgi:fatty acid/phospholipid biosynthesis enzyme